MSKPPFNPSAPFQAVASATKPSFNPNQPFQGLQEPEQEAQGFLSSIGDAAIDGIVSVGNAIDSYSGAPTRAAIDAGMNGQNPLIAFGAQFGEDPSLAPTGKQIAANAGLSTDSLLSFKVPVEGAQGRVVTGSNGKPFMKEEVSPAGMAGLGIDLVADPLNFIPVGLIAKNSVKVAGKAAAAAPKFVLKTSVAGIDLATGTAHASNIAETTSKYIDRVIDSTKSHFNPKVAPDFENFVEIAKKNDIDPGLLPETVEFGSNSTLAKKSKVLAEGPGGEKFQQKYLEAQGAIESALDRQVARIGGGAIPSDIDAGTALLDGYNKGLKSFFDQDMMTHTKVINSNPGMILNQEALKSVNSKIKGLKNQATGISRRGTAAQRAEAKAFLEGDLDILERSLDKNGNLSYRRGAEMLSNIGQEAFAKYPPGSKVPPNIQAKKDLYFALRDALYESSSHVMGPEAATELAMNNQLISDFLKDKGKISKIFEGDLAPEKLFERIANSGDTNQINALKEILSPEDFAKFKGALLNKTILRGADGSPLYKSTIKNLTRKKSALSIAFQPEEIAQFTDVLRLGDRTGEFVLNYSGTNTASRFAPKKFIENIVENGIGEIELEKLKEIARGKSKAITVPASDIKQVVTPPQARSILKKIPIFTSTTRQASKTGEVAAIQERNKEIERRKRAISGSK